MKKNIVNAYCMIYGILWCLAGWLQEKIDKSDFFAGMIFATLLIEVAYMSGVLQRILLIP